MNFSITLLHFISAYPDYWALKEGGLLAPLGLYSLFGGPPLSSKVPKALILASFSSKFFFEDFLGRYQ